ncbi:MAG: glycoside hydrolase family 13 protein [Terrisporobacter sp.]|uniref:glycoside hydrolase family 13 protein n=1 Tax=Terrisporobacter sp. TaxID=1965305 RepID=UPI0025F6720F|nr:glycoside hydrolase family 13 protein [uncultured Terrisporobacter sp.]
MCKTISFNSWNNYFKAPFGALKVNEGADIKVIINDESVYSINLIIEKEDENLNCYEVKRINLEKEDDKVYKCKIEPLLDSGIYYYYFEVEVNRYGQNQKLFYGKVKQNGEACEYSFENLNKYQLTVYEENKVPDWFKEGVLYHIFIDRFNNGNRTGKPSNPKKNSFIYGNWDDDPMYIKDKEGNITRWDFYGGNLKGIINKLGYLKKLGVSIIYLSPVFESSSNHKYNTGNYKNIDPMFGDEEIFKELIDKANAKGISIILDGVFSHTGADSIYFNKFNNYDSKGAYDNEDSPYRNWYTFDDSKVGYKCWWGVNDLPDINELEPTYMDYIINDENSVLNKWTKMGVKGWRLDVVDELPDKFVTEFKRELKSTENDTVLVGEVWEDASNKVSYSQRRKYLLGKQLDSVMGYPFRKEILSFLNGEIASYQINDAYMSIKENYPPESFKSNLNLIGTHDVKRIKTELNEDKDMVKLAVLAQMTFEGVPYIYYGDEAGLSGGVDPDNRRTYPWKNEDNDMIDFYRNSIQTRHRIKSLLKGETKFIYTMDDDVFAYERLIDDENEDDCLIIINRSNDYKHIDFDLDYDLLDEIGIKYTPGDYGITLEKEDGKFKVDIDPKSFMIFKMKHIKKEEV